MARKKETQRKYYASFEDLPLDEFMMRNLSATLELLAGIKTLLQQKEEPKRKRGRPKKEKIVEIDDGLLLELENLSGFIPEQEENFSI